jgi:hypothetical protein
MWIWFKYFSLNQILCKNQRELKSDGYISNFLILMGKYLNRGKVMGI